MMLASMAEREESHNVVIKIEELMKIIYNRYLPFPGYLAMSVGPWILCRHGAVITAQVEQHEGIHWAQQKELLIVGFYLLYLLLFLWELLRCTLQPSRGQAPQGRRRRNLWERAYRSIAFEREAYQNEDVQFYIRHREHYAWLKS